MDNTVRVEDLKVADAERNDRKVTERVLVQSEISKNTRTTNNFTVETDGTVASDTEFAFSATNVTAVFLPKEEQEMIFTADKKLHWIIAGADDAMSQFAFVGFGVRMNFAHVSINPYAIGIKAGYTQSELSPHVYSPGNVYKVVNGATDIAFYYQEGEEFRLWYKVKKEVVALNNGTPMNWHTPRLGATAGISPDDHTNTNILTGVKLIDRTTTEGGTVSLSNYETKEYVNQAVRNNGGSVEKKYAILVVAGQSNAVGFDESAVDSVFKYGQHDRVKQLGLYGDQNLKVIPLGHCAQNFQNMETDQFTNPANPTLKGTKGIHLPLAKLLVEKIPSDYELVVVPMAYGGTGFTTANGFGTYDPNTKAPSPLGAYTWGVESAYLQAMKARIEHLLSLNPANYYIGTVWCQGEQDAADPATHNQAFTAMTQNFFDYFNTGNGRQYKNRVKSGEWGKKQWFTYETTNYWFTASPNKDGIAAIWDNYQTWSPETYVQLDRAHIKMNTNPSSTSPAAPESHFGQDAYADVIAPAVFAKMEAVGAI